MAAHRANFRRQDALGPAQVLWTLGQRERAEAIWKEGLLLNAENETLQETLKRLRVKP